MRGPFLHNCWLDFGIHFGAILGAKCVTILILGPLGLNFETLLLHLLFSVGFLMNVGVQLGGGVGSTTGGNIPAPVFFGGTSVRVYLTECRRIPEEFR